MIMERQFAPVIVFSFSKKDCEAYALQMSKLDFNSPEEKKLVDEVFNNAMMVLSEEDRALPQVRKLTAGNCKKETSSHSICLVSLG